MNTILFKYFLILIFLPLFSFSQENETIERPVSDTVPEAFRLEIPLLRERIYGKVPPAFKLNPKDDRRVFMYSHFNAISIHNHISDGTIYCDWPELENYLNAILQRVMPPELENDTAIQVYVSRDGEYNAFMLATGHIIFNIGVMASARNEAMIAGILAHELAHFYLDHGIQTFMKAISSGYGSYAFFNSKKYSKFSIQSETDADALALEWLNKAGYSFEGTMDFFELDNLVSKNEVARSKFPSKIEAFTHPTSEARLQKCRDYDLEHHSATAKLFQENQPAFSELREAAKPEVLKSLLNSMAYYDCIETAFRFYITDPENSSNVYYLLEAIRRLCYMNRNIWNQNFITNRYFADDTTGSSRDRIPLNKSLFASFDPLMIGFMEKDTVLIRKMNFWSNKEPFKTYEDAFVYFYQVSQEQKNYECILTNALSLNHNKKAQDKYLQKYLSHTPIRYREFALCLLKDSIFEVLDTSRLLVLRDFVTQINFGKESLLITPQPQDTIPYMNLIMDSLSAGFNKWETLLMTHDKYNHVNEYSLLAELHQFSLRPTISIGNPVELPMIDPRYWYLFKSRHINRIEFVYCNYEDPIRGSFNADSYRQLVENGVTPLFFPPERKRFLDMYLTSLSIQRGGQTKKRHHYSTHFENRKAGIPEIASELVSQIKRKENQPESIYFILGENLFLEESKR